MQNSEILWGLPSLLLRLRLFALWKYEQLTSAHEISADIRNFRLHHRLLCSIAVHRTSSQGIKPTRSPAWGINSAGKCYPLFGTQPCPKKAWKVKDLAAGWGMPLGKNRSPDLGKTKSVANTLSGLNVLQLFWHGRLNQIWIYSSQLCEHKWCFVSASGLPLEQHRNPLFSPRLAALSHSFAGSQSLSLHSHHWSASCLQFRLEGSTSKLSASHFSQPSYLQHLFSILPILRLSNSIICCMIMVGKVPVI